MSERDHEREEFEGWPQPAWAGEPGDPPRKQRQAYAASEEDDAAEEGAELAAAVIPELTPEQLIESEPVGPAAEPVAGTPKDEDEDEDEQEQGLDLSAEHHDDEQWSQEDPAPDAAVADAAEAEPEPEVEPEEPAEPEQPSLEHAGGELDVPPGYVLLEGEPRGERRSVGIVVSRFNGGITNRMLETALDALAEAGVPPDAVTVMPVPGAFELPLAAMALAKTRRYACIVALGAVIRGGTPHFEYVATEAASGLQLAQIETGVPVAFGVLTCDTVGQAEERIYKAREAVESALEMADVFAKLRATAKAG